MPIQFSLICPTKERPSPLQRLIQSIQDTTFNKNNIELILIIDDNDTITLNFIPSLLNSFKNLNIKYFTRTSSIMLNQDYYNFGASQSEGKYIWIIGDDVIFLVSNWDEIVYNKIESYLSDKPDKIVCAGIKDTTPKPKPSLPMFPCFPLVSRIAFEQMGFVLHPFIPTWGADYLIYLLYTGAGRYLEIADRDYLHHISVHTKTAPKDNTAVQVERTFNQLKMNDLHNIDLHASTTIPKQIEELKQKIIQLGGKI